MDIEENHPDDSKYYVENLLFNNDILIISQFIKDLSFEKQDEFDFFEEEDFRGKTKFDLNIDVKHEEKENNNLLVTLSCNLVGSLNDKNIFVLDLSYCGVFQLPSIGTEMLDKQLKIECPRMLFPYVRRLISQLMIEGGLPNVDIKNINFFDLYKKNNLS